jgi:hypothetical protein
MIKVVENTILILLARQMPQIPGLMLQQGYALTLDPSVWADQWITRAKSRAKQSASLLRTKDPYRITWVSHSFPSANRLGS